VSVCVIALAYLFGQVQQIVRKEEWDAFMNVLRKPLPATFRINAW